MSSASIYAISTLATIRTDGTAIGQIERRRREEADLLNLSRVFILVVAKTRRTGHNYLEGIRSVIKMRFYCKRRAPHDGNYTDGFHRRARSPRGRTGMRTVEKFR